MFIEGLWKTEIRDRDGNVYSFPIERNSFVINVTKAIAYSIVFKKLDIYHAFGEGDVLWDTTPPSDADLFDVKLINEFHRQVPDNVSFYTGAFGKAQGGTNLQIDDPRRLEGTKLVGRIEDTGSFVGQTINITAGTNLGLSRVVTSYDQASGSIIVDSVYPTSVDSTTEYEIVGVDTSVPTNTVRIRTTIPFGTNTSPYNYKDIREQGIYLGNPTATKDSGFLINIIRHPKINKHPGIELTRYVILTFRI